MKELFYAIGDFFGWIFNGIEFLGNIPNYFYVGVIFIFLVVSRAFSKELKSRSTKIFFFTEFYSID